MLVLYLAPVLALVVLEVFFVHKAAANRKRVKLIARTPIAKIAELADGPAKVQGRIVAFGDSMTAPLSGRPCVYYRFQVEEKKTRHGPPLHGGGGSYWKTIINDVQSIPCGVDDGTGVAGLDLRGAEMVLSPGAQMRSGFLNDAPAKLERLLNERYGRSSRGFIFNKGMRYIETLIEGGEEVLVLARAQTTPGGNWQFSKCEIPFIVSNQNEKALIKSYKRWVLLWLVLAVLVLVIPCLALAWLLL
jgi:hypothetical protein